MKKLFLAVLAVVLALPGAATASSSKHKRPPRTDAEVSISDASAVESDGELTFEVSLDAATDVDVYVVVKLYSGSAKKWFDFKGYTPPVLIPAGETTAPVPVEIYDDHKAERDEFLRAVITRTNADRGDRRARGVIYDDDSSPLRTQFELDVLHVNDHHSHLTDSGFDFFIDGEEVDIELGEFSRVVTAFDELEAELGDDANVAKVHAGDAITGTLFYTLFDGEADAAMMNEVCFDVFALGNHEFDASDAGLVTFLDFLADGPCNTPVLAANVVPEIGTPLAPENPDDYILPFTIKQYGNQKVGFVGIDIAQKTQVSSQPLDTTQFLDEVTTAQLYIDVLTAMRVNKIVLVTHQGYANDLDLASMVVGADVIVGGDSHSLLGDFDAFGLSTPGPYATVTTDMVGNTVCVVQAWEYSQAVGHLEVGFDKRGRVTECGGTPYLMFGDVRDFDEDGNGTALTQEQVDEYLAANGQRTWAKDADADALIADYSAQVDVLAAEVIGTATEDICLGRFPNDGRDAGLCGGVTPFGGEIQQVVTHAFLARAFNADIALQNSGGVRINIPAGDVSIATAYELLPFANTLVELEMTGAEIRLALEQGLGNTLDNGGSSGAFPYGSGIRWDLDASQDFGERFSGIEVRRKGEADFAPLDDDATYIVVANSFMVGGGDGYQVLADVAADGRSTDTFLDYAQSFIDWIEQDAGGAFGKPTEYSLKSYIPAP